METSLALVIYLKNENNIVRLCTFADYSSDEPLAYW